METTMVPISRGIWKMQYIYTMKFHSATKNNNIILSEYKVDIHGDYHLSELSQSQKDEHHIFLSIADLTIGDLEPM